MITRTQPQTLVPPVKANAAGVPPDRQPSGDIFSALYEADPDAQIGSALALPDPSGGVGAIRTKSATDATITRNPAARHTIHRHSPHIALALALPETPPRPTDQTQDDSDLPEIAGTQPDEPAPPVSDAAILVAILVPPLESVKPAPPPVTGPIVGTATEIVQPLEPAPGNSQTRTAVPADAKTKAPAAPPAAKPLVGAPLPDSTGQQPVPATHNATPPRDLAMSAAPPRPEMPVFSHTDQTQPQSEPKDAVDATLAAKAAHSADQQSLAPSRPTWSIPPKSAHQSSELRQVDTPPSPALTLITKNSMQSQTLTLLQQSAKPATAVPVSTDLSSRNPALPPNATLLPAIPLRDRSATQPNAPALQPTVRPEILLMIPVPAALRSHLAWRTAGMGHSQIAAPIGPSQSAPKAAVRAIAQPATLSQTVVEQSGIGPLRDDPADASGSAADSTPIPSGLPLPLTTPAAPSHPGQTVPDLAAPPPQMPVTAPLAASHAALPKGLSGAIVRAAVKPADPDRVELTLDPIELGRVRFALVSNGDQVQVSLSIERSETLDLLRRHAGELRAELREQGFANPTLSFGQWGQDKSADHPQAASDFADTPPPPTPEPIAFTRIPAAGLDLRL